MAVKVLDVKIDTYTRGEALDKVGEFVSEEKGYMIFTPNPEMLVAAHQDQYLKEILNSSSLNICDGKGLGMAIGCERIPGIDFMIDICGYAEKNGYTVYLLGSESEGVLLNTAQQLEKKFPELKIVGHHPGPKLESLPNKKLEYKSSDNEQIKNDIIKASPDILFVGFGHGKQEKWIYENIDYLSGVKVVMGVGGSFDMISGKLRRAPKIIRKIGFEWLWRLIQQPSRIGRIWTALVKFPILFLAQRKNK